MCSLATSAWRGAVGGDAPAVSEPHKRNPHSLVAAPRVHGAGAGAVRALLVAQLERGNVERVTCHLPKPLDLVCMCQRPLDEVHLHILYARAVSSAQLIARQVCTGE